MPVREHNVSFRNGPQVMVAGLKLRDMGYCRGARVQVTDPSGNPANDVWQFEVSNEEHATLVSRNPEPPTWIQPGMRIRIEVRPPKGIGSQEKGYTPSEPPLTPSRLADWRRELIRLLDQIEGTKQAVANEGVAGRISRLSRAGHIPREVAAFMRTVTEMRNQTEYQAKVLTSAESEAVTAAWRAVEEWAKRRGLALRRA